MLKVTELLIKELEFKSRQFGSGAAYLSHMLFWIVSRFKTRTSLERWAASAFRSPPPSCH